MSKLKSLLWPVLVVAGIAWLTTSRVRSAAESSRVELQQVQNLTEIDDSTLQAVNEELARLRDAAVVQQAEPADDYTMMRRLSLALHGTVPSLEEIRKFESDQRPERLQIWLEYLLTDDRFNDYFAERLARSFVGVENGQFLIFRRDRFLDWLATQLRENRSYDKIVGAMISGTGVWTGQGEVNFMTSSFANDEFDPNKLTARSVRAFLGQRMDCAQCHDHPFDKWKQTEFHGLAAHFSQVKMSLAGVVDDPEKEHKYEDRASLEETEIAPAVPFHPEWLGKTGSRRERLAQWVTHPENERFHRAAANRVWALMFGKPFLIHRPVDDIPDPGTDPESQLLDILGADFQKHNCDLRRLIRLIARSDAFKMSSQYSKLEGEIVDEQELERAEQAWAVFPLVRLRPEQVIGSMLQANHVRTIDQNSHLLVRTLRFFRENDFVDEFGDPGVDELQDRSGTIPQALLRMNGKLSRELTEGNPFTAPGRINIIGSSIDQKIETIYLSCLTRYPTTQEQAHFHESFENGESKQAVEDLFWILFNSPEFSWNH